MADENIASSLKIVTRAEARVSGLKRFFTGRLCKRGHIAERSTSNGTCFDCANRAARISNANNPAPNRARATKHRLDDPAGYNARRRAQWASLPFEVRQAIGRKRSEQRNADPEKTAAYIAARKVTKAKRRARKFAAEGNSTAADIRRIYDAQSGKCADCKKSLKKGYHADHIVALARGGSNWPRNVQLLCASCNIRKSAKHPLVWAKELGRLL
jgi:5-methylcytosine-specific restriction endonuclease McrA